MCWEYDVLGNLITSNAWPAVDVQKVDNEPGILHRWNLAFSLAISRSMLGTMPLSHMLHGLGRAAQLEMRQRLLLRLLPTKSELQSGAGTRLEIARVWPALNRVSSPPRSDLMTR